MEAMNKTARLSAVFGEPSGAASVAGSNARCDGLINKGEASAPLSPATASKDIKAAIETAAPRSIFRRIWMRWMKS